MKQLLAITSSLKMGTLKQALLGVLLVTLVTSSAYGDVGPSGTPSNTQTAAPGDSGPPDAGNSGQYGSGSWTDFYNWATKNVGGVTAGPNGGSIQIGPWTFGADANGNVAMGNQIAGGGMMNGPYYNARINNAACRLLALPEGSFGGLIMIASGIVAIVSGALGAYKMALSTLSIGAGAWILRPVVSLFFQIGCM